MRVVASRETFGTGGTGCIIRLTRLKANLGPVVAVAAYAVRSSSRRRWSALRLRVEADMDFRADRGADVPLGVFGERDLVAALANACASELCCSARLPP